MCCVRAIMCITMQHQPVRVARRTAMSGGCLACCCIWVCRCVINLLAVLCTLTPLYSMLQGARWFMVHSCSNFFVVICGLRVRSYSEWHQHARKMHEVSMYATEAIHVL